MVNDAREPGLYAGYLSSASMFGSMLSGIAWGRFADKHGRTLPLRVGMVCVAVTSVMFGFVFRAISLWARTNRCTHTGGGATHPQPATPAWHCRVHTTFEHSTRRTAAAVVHATRFSSNFWLSVFLRFLQGLSNGTFIVSKVAISDICRPEHTARAMSVVFSMWGFALIAGPAAAGVLAHPERNMGSGLFPPTSIFVMKPYLLPTLVSALFCAIGFLASWLLRLPARPLGYAAVTATDDKGDPEGDEELAPLTATAAVTGPSSGAAAKVPSAQANTGLMGTIRTICSGPGAWTVRICIGLDLMRSFYVLGDDNMFPLLAAAPRTAGVLDYTTTDIGGLLGMAGVCKLKQLQVHHQHQLLLTVLLVPQR